MLKQNVHFGAQRECSPSCLALKMEKPSNWCVSLTLGRLTQRSHRRGFGWEEGDSVGPERNGPERQGDRLRMLGPVSSATHQIDNVCVPKFFSKKALVAVQGRLCVRPLEADCPPKGRDMD